MTSLVVRLFSPPVSPAELFTKVTLPLVFIVMLSYRNIAPARIASKALVARLLSLLDQVRLLQPAHGRTTSTIYNNV